jgi:hypothetical protein
MLRRTNSLSIRMPLKQVCDDCGQNDMLLSNGVNDRVETTIKEVGQFLEQQAKLGSPITYGDVIRKFPDLPALGPHWKSHPLCSIFGELDDEDHIKGRPFRTALVYAKETTRPGQGFFDTITNLRNKTILKSEQDKVWTDELKAVIAHYA